MPEVEPWGDYGRSAQAVGQPKGISDNCYEAPMHRVAWPVPDRVVLRDRAASQVSVDSAPLSVALRTRLSGIEGLCCSTPRLLFAST